MDIKFEKTACFTGHRPDKLGFGYDYRTDGNRKIILKLRAVIERLIVKRGIDTFVSGMALGIDTWSALTVLKLKEKYPHIRLVCAVPCSNHSSKWKNADKETWTHITREADHVHYVSEDSYTAWCMQNRNKWMVDNSRFVIAVWDGVENGGTWNCIKYTIKRQRNIIHLQPKTLEVVLKSH